MIMITISLNTFSCSWLFSVICLAAIKFTISPSRIVFPTSLCWHQVGVRGQPWAWWAPSIRWRKRVCWTLCSTWEEFLGQHGNNNHTCTHQHELVYVWCNARMAKASSTRGVGWVARWCILEKTNHFGFIVKRDRGDLGREEYNLLVDGRPQHTLINEEAVCRLLTRCSWSNAAFALTLMEFESWERP